MTTATATATKPIRIPAKTMKSIITVFRKLHLANAKMLILRCIFFDNGCIRATDLERELIWRGNFPKDISLALKFKDLADVVKLAKASDEVVIHPADPDSDICTIQVGPRSAQVATLPMNDAPETTTGHPLGNPVLFDELDEQLVEANRYASDNEIRYILNGVYLDKDKGVLVATNGSVLLRKLCSPCLKMPVSAIIPSKAIELFSAKALKERPVELRLFSRTMPKKKEEQTFPTLCRMVLGDGEWTIWSKLIEGLYPNYEQVVPKWEDSWFGIIREPQAKEFLEFLKGLPLTKSAESSNRYVLVQFEGSTLSVVHPNKGGARSETTIDGIVSASREPVAAAFNPDYLITLLESGCTRWRMKDELSPIMANGPDSRMAIVMPLRMK